MSKSSPLNLQNYFHELGFHLCPPVFLQRLNNMRSRLFLLCTLLTFAFTAISTSTLRAQIIQTYGLEFSSSGTTHRILQVTNGHLATGSVSVAIDLAGFSQAGGTILNAPVGTVLTGTSLNGAGYDTVTKRLYFRDNLGQGNLFYWTRGASTITYAASAATIMAGGASNLADSATVYNGGYFYMEGGTDTLYRYDIATGGVRRFADISGGTNRSYDFGDLAVNPTNGLLYINGNRSNGDNNVLDRIDISAITATTGTPTNFTIVQTYGNSSDGSTQQMYFDPVNNNLVAVQSVTGQYNERTWHTINTGNGNQTGNIWTSTQNFSDLAGPAVVPEPAVLAGGSALFVMGYLIYRNRRKAFEAKLEQPKAEEPQPGTYTEFETE